MKIVTWNIYWFGDRFGENIKRTRDDESLIAAVISNMKPDVLAVQEVVDPAALGCILREASEPGWLYRMRGDGGVGYTSSPTADSPQDNWQKIFLCINDHTVEFINGAAIRGASGRRPYAAHLRHRQSGHEFTLIAVHLQAGYPYFDDVGDAVKRTEQAEAIVRWLRGKAVDLNPSFPTPATQDIVIMGDFNAEKVGDPNNSLLPFAQGDMANWQWSIPLPDNGHSHTAIEDKYIIDHIIFSPSIATSAPEPQIYAYDYDPALGGPEAFHGLAAGVKRVSDHRPVTCILDW